MSLRKQTSLATRARPHLGATWSRDVPTSRPRLVPEFLPTRYELARLAQHYLDAIYMEDSLWLDAGELVRTALQRFAERRLSTIEKFLGKETIARELASVRDMWDPLFPEVSGPAPGHGPALDLGDQEGEG